MADKILQTEFGEQICTYEDAESLKESTFANKTQSRRVFVTLARMSYIRPLSCVVLR